MRKVASAAAAASLVLCTCAYAQSPPPPVSEPPVLRIPRVSRPPAIEDFVEGTRREAEVRVRDFRQNVPHDGTPASQETTAYLSYDEENLYVVFVCKDDPEKIRARLARREDIDTDDNVGIDLDTFHDRQRFYMFLVNPRGVQQDAIVTEGQDPDFSFDTLWYSDARLTADGFVAWMAIPFRSLRFPDAPAQRWGVAIGRLVQRNGELSFWPYITERIESTTRQFAVLEGLEGISPGRNVQFIPYVAGTGARFLDRLTPAGSEFRDEAEARPGLDAKMVVRDALTFDFTLNPDFSQVESDEPQVTVNQRFEVFFPEKRPFFIENAGYFQTPIDLFFSRRIADPRFGARLTGKVGPWALGVLAIDDDREPRAGIAVARAQREFSSRSRVGVLLTSRDAASASNRVFSVDARVTLGPNWVVNAQAAGSDTRRPDGGRSSGPAGWAELAYTGRHAAYAARYADYDPRFESQLGFIPRVDIRKAEQYFRYYWKPDAGPVLLFGPDVTASLNWNRDGEIQDRIVDVSFGGDVRGPTGMGCRHVNAYELFLSTGFRRHYTDCGIDTKRLHWLELNVDYGWGTAVNYYPARGLSPFLADANSVSAAATLRPTHGISVANTYMYTRLANVFDDRLFRSKLNVQLTRELSLRAIVDYHRVSPNPLAVSLSNACAACGTYLSTRRLTGDLLMTWLLHPGTAVYVGYTERRENPLDLSLPLHLQLSAVPTFATGRQVFVKASYLLRY